MTAIDLIKDRLSKTGASKGEIAAFDALVVSHGEMRAALEALYDACELRANREGGDFGPDIGPAAELADLALSNLKIEG